MIGMNQYLCHSIPIITKDSALYDQLIEAVNIIESLLIPARISQILPILVKLRIHFPITILSGDEISILMRDYLTNLSSYPLDIIEQTGDEYISDGKNNHFPKIGQLLEVIKVKWCLRKYKLKKLKKLLEVSNKQ